MSLSSQSVTTTAVCTIEGVPRLWNDTIEAHRAAVRNAVLDAAATLVAEHGLTGVTMSAIAELTGIGRATLYKYFPDVEAILVAWHDRQITQHLDHLTAVRNQADNPSARLQAVLLAYARLSRHRHAGDLATTLHRTEHVSEAHRRLQTLVEDVLIEAARAGEIRDDVPAAELAAFCLHALTAASAVTTEAGVHRLVALALAGLRPSAVD